MNMEEGIGLSATPIKYQQLTCQMSLTNNDAKAIKRSLSMKLRIFLLI